MARKMSEKPHSIRLLRWFNFSSSGSRKNNRKAFEGASMEPTIKPVLHGAILLATCLAMLEKNSLQVSGDMLRVAILGCNLQWLQKIVTRSRIDDYAKDG